MSTSTHFKIRDEFPEMPRPFFLHHGFREGNWEFAPKQLEPFRHCLYICLNGRMLCRIRNHEESVEPGQAVLIPVDEDVCMRSDLAHPAPVESQGFQFMGHAGISMGASIIARFGNVISWVPEPGLQSRLRAISGQGPIVDLSQSEASALVFTVLTTLLQSNQPTGLTPAAELVDRVRTYVLRNYRQPIDGESLAIEHGVTREHLARVFRREMGVTLHQYVTQVRIRKACRVLSSTSVGQKQIAWDCGYPSLSSFYRVFKTTVGVTPAEYRKRPYPLEAIQPVRHGNIVD